MESVWSLIHACITAYSSKTRQCRLGYDTSPQCDSFQLGEFIRFLTRCNLLQFTSNLTFEQPATGNRKDVSETLTTLKGCPNYQLDSNHSHCGPRKQLLAGLRFIESCLTESEIGICLDCWNDRNNVQRSWSQGRDALIFDVARASRERARWRGMPRGHATHSSPHQENAASGFFTAEEKLWNLEGSAGSDSIEGWGSIQTLRPTLGMQ